MAASGGVSDWKRSLHDFDASMVSMLVIECPPATVLDHLSL